MGGETADPFTPAFDDTVRKLMRDWHVPGLSIAITDHGRISTKGYGYADLKTKRPAEPETLFYVASITKHMFSAAFVHYLESAENKTGPNFSLQTPLAKIIRDDFVLDTPHTTATTTIEDVLCHRSGLPRFDITYGGPIDSPRKIVRHLRHLALTAPPRTKFQYCNIGFVTATHALEALTGKSFPQYMHETVFEPTGMDHTFGTLNHARRASNGKHQLATPYAWENDKLVQREHIDGAEISGAGALISNVADWAKWLNLLLRRNGPVSETVFREITTPRIVSSDLVPEPWDNVSLYCLGLQRCNYRGVEIFSHTGGHVGFTGNMILIPSLQWAAIMFCNSESTGGNCIVGLGYQLVDDLLRIPEKDRVDGDRYMRERDGEFEKRLADAKDRIYPTLPEPPLPAAYPLENYAGTYSNPAFRKFTFTARNLVGRTEGGNVADGKTVLECRPKDRFWPMTLTLEHVSGEYWFGRSLSLLRFGFKAEFRLDASGRVAKLGMALDETDETKLWWFDRVDEEDDTDSVHGSSSELMIGQSRVSN